LQAPASAAFLCPAEPRELRVQLDDRLSGGLGRGRENGLAGWPRLGLSLQACTPIAGLRFAAARANAPQLLRGLIKENVGRVGHGFSWA